MFEQVEQTAESINPFDWNQEEKEQLFTKREEIRKRLESEGYDTMTLEEQKIIIEACRAFREVKFQFASAESKVKESKKRIKAEAAEPKVKKPKIISKAKYIKLLVKEMKSLITEEEKEQKLLFEQTYGE